MNPSKNNLRIGSFGESVAARYLSSIGYKILELNFKKRYGEIDIVALDGQTLVFVEVKTRKTSQFGTGEDAITSWKLRSLIKSAQFYKLLHPQLPEDIRIDMVSIRLTVDNQVEKINLYRNITL